MFNWGIFLARHRRFIVDQWQIREITQIRLKAGFPLADVQKAFELFRQITCGIRVDAALPKVKPDKGKVAQLVINLLLNAVESVNESGKILLETGLREPSAPGGGPAAEKIP